MLASEFINTMVFGMLKGMNKYATKEDMQATYDKSFFYLPRVYCKDGFNISIQVNNGNYCVSENGVRTFGLNWIDVEWGFPSQDIDGVKYNAESEDTTDSVGGYVDVKLIDELCEEHGGIDLQATLTNGMYSNE